MEYFSFFFFFFQIIGFDISCRLSPKEIVCMKCLSLFSGKIRKIFQNVSSADFFFVCFFYPEC